MSEKPVTAETATIRPAGLADAAEIARLHVRVWRETYRAFATPQALAALDEERRLAQWRAALAPPAEGRETLMAEANGALVAFVSFGPPSQPAFGDQAEIKHLYVDADHHGAGLGRRLMEAAFERLAKQGREAVALAVVEENEPARRFYRRLGGAESGRFVDAGPLWRSANVIVSWSLRRTERP